MCPGHTGKGEEKKEDALFTQRIQRGAILGGQSILMLNKAENRNQPPRGSGEQK